MKAPPQKGVADASGEGFPVGESEHYSDEPIRDFADKTVTE